MRNSNLLFFVIVLFFISFLYKSNSSNVNGSVSVSENVLGPVLQVRAEPVDTTDTLRNLYAPPLRYNDAEFRQLGYLTSDGVRLPLFGRKIGRDKWTYYTMQEGIKLPIEYNRRVCTQSPGCNEMSDKDEATVEGVTFKVHVYDVQTWGY
jgi:hypothetical protein